MCGKQGFHVTGYSGKELPDEIGENSHVVCWQCQQPTTATRETVTAMVIGGEALLCAGLFSQVSFHISRSQLLVSFHFHGCNKGVAARNSHVVWWQRQQPNTAARE